MWIPHAGNLKTLITLLQDLWVRMVLTVNAAGALKVWLHLVAGTPLAHFLLSPIGYLGFNGSNGL